MKERENERNKIEGDKGSGWSIKMEESEREKKSYRKR